jgi:hypothetical protein
MGRPLTHVHPSKHVLAERKASSTKVAEQGVELRRTVDGKGEIHTAQEPKAASA